MSFWLFLALGIVFLSLALVKPKQDATMYFIVEDEDE